MDQSPHRRPVNWTALQALENLSPPSPSPSGSLDALATLASSGEIPIFLHSSCEQLKSRPNSTALQRHRSMNLLKPSSSMATFRSTNTFGEPLTARSRVQNLDAPTPDDASERTVRQRSFRSSDVSYVSTRISRSTSYWNNRFSAVSELDASHLSILGNLGSTSITEPESPSRPDYCGPPSSPSVPFSVSASESIVISPEPPYPSQTNFDAFKFPITPAQSPRLARTPSRTWSPTPASLLRQSVSSSPSEDFSTGPSVRFHSSLLRRAFPSRSPSLRSDKGDSPRKATRSPSPSPLSRSQHDSLPVSPTSPRFAALSSSTLADSRTASSGSGSSTRIHKGVSARVDLPDVLNWLRDIRFELWIDQEGFRRIQPKFRLVGYTPPSPFPDMACDNDMTHGIALFRPVRRETSIYHHSILDSLPALRRLTLADSEDKDYISRQASLTIKANGVYVVTGTESFEDLPPASPGNGLSQAANNFLNFGPDHVEQPKLRWRFEYMVEDRKNDSGKTVAGEKVLTPLSFSCSPGLLHPSHGKPIHLMRVLMKNMIPKLSSAKLTATSAAAQTQSQRPVGRVGSEAIRGALGSIDLPRLPPIAGAKNLIRTLSAHRRTRSSEPSSAPWSPGGYGVTERARPASLSDAACRTVPRVPVLPTRDAGNDTSVSLFSRSAQPSSPTPRAGPPGRLSRQILTREELAAILASFPTPGSGDAGATLTSGVGALSPPSYYRHRRAQSDLERVDELGIVAS